MEASPDAIVVVDAKARIVQTNPRATELFGRKPEDLVGKPLDMLMPERYRTAHTGHMRGFFDAPKMRPMGGGLALYGLRRDGTEFPIEISLSSYNGEDGTYAIASVRDITDRKHAEAEMRRWFEAFSKAEVGLAIADADNNNMPVMVNPAFALMFRSPIKEVAGKPRETFYAEKEHDRVGSMLRIADIEGHVGFEATMQRADKTQFEGFVSITSVPPTVGEPRRRITTVIDITGQKQTEDLLRQAQKMEAIGNLTGGMAHDFNNMLGVIVGNLELLKRLIAENPVADELCDEALAGANRGADLIRRLLAFARRQSLNPERTNVNVVVTGTTKMLGRILGGDIAISARTAPEVWPVMVDPVQLEAALINLATNARDAMPGGGTLGFTTSNTYLDEHDVAQHPEVQRDNYGGRSSTIKLANLGSRRVAI